MTNREILTRPNNDNFRFGPIKYAFGAMALACGAVFTHIASFDPASEVISPGDSTFRERTEECLLETFGKSVLELQDGRSATLTFGDASISKSDVADCIREKYRVAASDSRAQRPFILSFFGGFAALTGSIMTGMFVSDRRQRKRALAGDGQPTAKLA